MGIWLIIYRVEDRVRDKYLSWFHDVHIPEKLAREGYEWAAHYEVPVIEEESISAQPRQYLAMFGGDSTRVFYDPSPAQLKPTQDELTREMIGYRGDVNMFIVSSEWSTGEHRSIEEIDSIRLGIFPLANKSGQQNNDQSVGAYCAQQLFPSLIPLSDVGTTEITVTKLLASTGTSRHLVLEQSQRSVTEMADKAWPQADNDCDFELIPASRIWPVS